MKQMQNANNLSKKGRSKTDKVKKRLQGTPKQLNGRKNDADYRIHGTNKKPKQNNNSIDSFNKPIIGKFIMLKPLQMTIKTGKFCYINRNVRKNDRRNKT